MRIALASLAVCALAACGQSNAPSSPTPDEMAAAVPTPTPQARTAEEISKIVSALPAPYNAGDYAKGQKVFAQCRSCHSIAAGAPNIVGPNLHGVIGRKAGTLASFHNYSDGLKGLGTSWDPASLDKWVTNPRAVVQNTNMGFFGVKDPMQRRDLIAYIAVESGS